MPDDTWPCPRPDRGRHGSRCAIMVSARSARPLRSIDRNPIRVVELTHTAQKEVTIVERWERRARKLDSKRKRMKMSGRSLITVIQPIIMKRAQEAKRAGKEKDHPARDAA